MQDRNPTCSVISMILALLLGSGAPPAGAEAKPRGLPSAAQMDQLFDTTPMSREEWARTIKNDPAVPRTADQLEALARELFQGRGESVDDSDRPRCGTLALARLESGLRNPGLSGKDLRAVSQIVVDNQPDLPNKYESSNFEIRYKDGTGTGEISRPTAKLIAGSLEKYRLAFIGEFGRSVNKTGSKIIVKVYKRRQAGGAYSSGTILLDSRTMKDGPRWINNTSSHELFHALQAVYSVGHTVAQWFYEGSAAWAASYFTGGWVEIKELADFADYGEVSIFGQGYAAMPFIAYIQGFEKNGSAKTWPIKFLLQNLQSQKAHGKAPNARVALGNLLKDLLQQGHQGIPELTCRYTLAKVGGDWRRQGVGYRRTEDISYLTPLKLLKAPRRHPSPRVKTFTESGSIDAETPARFADVTLKAGTANLFKVSFPAGQYVGQKVKATLTSSSNLPLAAATISATTDDAGAGQDASSDMAFLTSGMTSVDWPVGIPDSSTNSVYVGVVDARGKNLVGDIQYSLKVELQPQTMEALAASQAAGAAQDAGKKASVSLVLDKSGSMALAVAGSTDTQIDLLHTDADTFITVMQNAGLADDKLGKIGLVSYSNSATTLSSLKLLDAAGTVAEGARTAVDSLTAGGATNIKGGITLGHSMLEGDVGSTTYQPAMILFSDGEWNTGGDPTKDLDTDIPIYTIGYNSMQSYISYLKTIASDTSGKYYHTGDPTILSSIYFDIVDDTDIGDAVTNVTHKLVPYTPQAVTSKISAGTDAAVFATAWIDHSVTYVDRTPAKGELSLVLHDPSGTRVTPTAVDAPPGKGYAVLTVSQPAAGDWTLYGWFGSAPKLDDVGTAFGTFVPPDSISLSLELPGAAGDPGVLTVRARVTDGGEPVQVSRVQAHLVRPRHSRQALHSRFEDRIQQLKARFSEDGETDPAEAALRVIRQERLPEEDIFEHEKVLGSLTSALAGDWQQVAFEEVRAGVPHQVYVTVSGYSPRSLKHFTRTRTMTVFPGKR